MLRPDQLFFFVFFVRMYNYGNLCARPAKASCCLWSMCGLAGTASTGRIKLPHQRTGIYIDLTPEEFFYFPHMRELFPLIRMASECRMREAQGKWFCRPHIHSLFYQCANFHLSIINLNPPFRLFSVKIRPKSHFQVYALTVLHATTTLCSR